MFLCGGDIHHANTLANFCRRQQAGNAQFDSVSSNLEGNSITRLQSEPPHRRSGKKQCITAQYIERRPALPNQLRLDARSAENVETEDVEAAPFEAITKAGETRTDLQHWTGDFDVRLACEQGIDRL
jgi:hypothetical protein